jgi:heat shock protein HtpX
VLVIGIGYLLGWYYQAPEILVLAMVFSITQALVAYYASDRIALAVSGAREAERQDFLRLHRVVENLAITAGLPKPKIYVIKDSAPNAFAAGRDPKHSSIAVTTGLLEKLNKVQLEGVISHELSHIKNYDVRLMTMVVILVGTIALILDMFLRWSLWGGFSSQRREGGGWLVVIGFVLIIFSYLFAWLIQLSISRKREYLADASGALLTRYPEGLAQALEIISRDRRQLAAVNRATAHLFISNPFKGKGLALFSTHPSVRERIARLRRMIKV